MIARTKASYLKIMPSYRHDAFSITVFCAIKMRASIFFDTLNMDLHRFFQQVDSTQPFFRINYIF